MASLASLEEQELIGALIDLDLEFEISYFAFFLRFLLSSKLIFVTMSIIVDYFNFG